MMEIHLSDITTVEGELDRLRRCAAIAQQETERRARTHQPCGQAKQSAS